MGNHFTIRIILLVAISLGTIAASAQTDFRAALQDKTTLDEVMTEVNNYYRGQPEDWQGPNGDLPRMLQWKRWEWYMSGRLGPHGEFVDIQTLLNTGQRAIERNWPEGRTINPSWSSVGPSTTTKGIGRADRIAFHPSDSSTFWVTSPAGGVWSTTNGGASWVSRSNNIPSPGASGIVINWANANQIYILTGDGDSDIGGGFVKSFGYMRRSIGVLKSTDGGTTWKPTGELTTSSFKPYRLRQDPTNASVLLVATSLGVYRTTNAGASWTRTLVDNIFDIEFKPGTNRAYAASDGAVYYSSDGGANWTAATFDVALSGAVRIELAVTPAITSRVYLLTGGVDAPGEFDGVYRSTNNGVSYVQRATTPNILSGKSDGSDAKSQSDYDHSIAVSSTNSNTVVTGGIRIWRSTNGASSFSYSSAVIHADVHELAFNPLSGTLYACTDGGVYRSYDAGQTWIDLTAGFRTSQFYHMRGTTLDNNYFLGGFQDNGVKRRSTNTASWPRVGGGDGFDVAFQSDDKSKFYATVNKKLYYYTSNGSSNDNVTPNQDTSGNYQWFGTIATHVNDGAVVFVGYSDVFRSDDNGTTWTNKGVSGSWALATCPSFPSRIYAAGGADFTNGAGGLYRSNNLGDTWTSIHTTPGFPASGTITKITDVDVHPLSSSVVMATIGGFTAGVKVYRSIDAGVSWSNWSGSLPDIPVNCVKIAVNGDVYIGTDLGVFYRNTGMTDWMPYNNRLPNVPVTDLNINEPQGKVYASTFGRGMWRSSVPTACTSSFNLSTSLTGYRLYQASNEITSTSDIIGGLGTSIHFQGQNRVILNPGFRTFPYTVFSAYISGCGSGGIPDPVGGEAEEEEENVDR